MPVVPVTGPVVVIVRLPVKLPVKRVAEMPFTAPVMVDVFWSVNVTSPPVPDTFDRSKASPTVVVMLNGDCVVTDRDEAVGGVVNDCVVVNAPVQLYMPLPGEEGAHCA
jgi:hypothetical protein